MNIEREEGGEIVGKICEGVRNWGRLENWRGKVYVGIYWGQKLKNNRKIPEGGHFGGVWFGKMAGGL